MRQSMARSPVVLLGPSSIGLSRSVIPCVFRRVQILPRQRVIGRDENDDASVCEIASLLYDSNFAAALTQHVRL